MNAPRFPVTYCSQCGGTFGPGNAGYSHCRDHGARVSLVDPTDQFVPNTDEIMDRMSPEDAHTYLSYILDGRMTAQQVIDLHRNAA